MRRGLATLLGAVMLAPLPATPAAETASAAPKWLHLGEDEELKALYKESNTVVVACVFKAELKDVKPPFATVVYHATITRTYKGTVEVGDKISISFPTDDVPMDAAQRESFLKKAPESGLGELRFCFLTGTGREFSSEWVNVPRYTAQMRAFIAALQ